MMLTSASLFTGGGGFEVGAMMAGYKPVWGVEIRPDIAAVAERNIPGLKVIVADVAAVDYSALPRVDHLHASPSCKKASIANSEGGEYPEDIAAAEAVARAIKALRPTHFTLENVWGYRNFEAFKLIVRCLREQGYFVDWWHLNSADYAVPQTRQRLILIASLIQQPRRPQPTHSDAVDMFGVYKPWVVWYEAIEDLIPTLPESQFAPWQLERLPQELKEALLVPGGNNSFPTRDCEAPSFTITGSQAKNTRAFLLNRNKSERDDHYKPESDPAYTVCVESRGRQRAFVVDQINHRGDNGKSTIREQKEPIWTIPVYSRKHPAPRALAGRVVKMTPRALARFQSLPDSYALPEQNGLACEIIGNIVPPLLAKAIYESLI
jgi:DNA-cytosine methyltransferase